jgi:hypothetical protein
MASGQMKSVPDTFDFLTPLISLTRLISTFDFGCLISA